MVLRHIEADDDFRECMEACDHILTAKGIDYTQDGLRLKNFYRNGERLGLPAMKVLAVYMFKHVDAIETFLLRGKVESEPIEGRIHDAINYLLLLYKLIMTERRDLAHEREKAITEAAQGR